MKSKGKKRKTAVQHFFLYSSLFVFSYDSYWLSAETQSSPSPHTNTSHIRAYWGPGGATVIPAGWRH